MYSLEKSNVCAFFQDASCRSGCTVKEQWKKSLDPGLSWSWKKIIGASFCYLVLYSFLSINYQYCAIDGKTEICFVYSIVFFQIITNTVPFFFKWENISPWNNNIIQASLLLRALYTTFSSSTNAAYNLLPRTIFS